MVKIYRSCIFFISYWVAFYKSYVLLIKKALWTENTFWKIILPAH